MNIEPLESRIAPAIVFNFIDVDGDAVKVTISKGNPGDATLDKAPAGLLGGEQLRAIDLHNNQVFKGANITVTATPQDWFSDGVKDGDGFVNIGDIYGAGIDLGTVIVEGDLLTLYAGNAADPASACKGLTVQSLRRFVSGSNSTLISIIDGKLDKLTVKSDVIDASISVTDSVGTNGKIGSVFIGGSLIGGIATSSGSIYTAHGLGPVTIKGDIVGGLGLTSGAVTSDQAIASVTVGGSLRGGLGLTSGVIFSSLGSVGPVKIGGDIAGGDVLNTGRIFARTTLTSLTVGGSIFGNAENSGRVHSDGSIGPVKVGQAVVGGFGDGSGAIEAGGSLGAVTLGESLIGGFGTNSGKILSGAAMGAVTIGGSLAGGGGSSSGVIRSGAAMGLVKIGGDIVGGSTFGSGYIEGQRIASLFVGGSVRAGLTDLTGSVRAIDDIGPIVIKGNLAGRPDPDGNPMNGGATHAIISARGQAGLSATAKTDVAIKSITIGGRVELAQILAGYDTALQPKNADAQIGAVRVGGDWIASNLIVGVISADAAFGNSDDAKISGAGVKDNADNNGKGAISRIASLIIKGSAIGTTIDFDPTLFGIEAQHIVSIKLGGATVPLKAGAGNDLAAVSRPLGASLAAGGDFDFHAFEVLLT